MAMLKKEVSRLGALARIKKYGNPGTTEGRRRGGSNSVLSQANLNNNFKKAKIFNEPIDSKLLSEFLGILIGDGHLSKYQASITTNSETDIKHAIYIKNLIKKIFSLESSIKFKKGKKAVNIVVSSVKLVKWLNAKGMPIGNKLDKGLSIPEWIAGNKIYEMGFIRGLFDTDGCVYFDKHVIKGKSYKNVGWNITSYSAKLREELFQTLNGLGYNPTLAKTQKAVYLRKARDVKKYFREIGTSNPKHLARYKNGGIA